MFKCNCCGETFEEPKILHESRGEYWGFPSYEDIAVSPCCEEDFTEGKMYHVDGKVYALVNSEIVDESGRVYTVPNGEMMQVADFDDEYFAEDDGEALYDEVLADQMTKWCCKFGDDIDVDIEVYWEV